MPVKTFSHRCRQRELKCGCAILYSMQMYQSCLQRFCGPKWSEYNVYISLLKNFYFMFPTVSGVCKLIKKFKHFVYEYHFLTCPSLIVVLTLVFSLRYFATSTFCAIIVPMNVLSSCDSTDVWFFCCRASPLRGTLMSMVFSISKAVKLLSQHLVRSQQENC